MQEGQKGQGFNCIFDVLCLKRDPGASLVAQWLRIGLANAGDTGLSPGPG